MNDPFDTAGLRESVLRAWEASPTRFREDANAEEDLRLGGYRDRLLVELAQNAADAAGSDGVLRVELVDGELRAANIGAPLTADGVAALSSLRASAKRDDESVGRFGVGFAAVLAVSDAPRVLSTSGGVAFSADRTREEVAALKVPAEELAARGGAVPVLRLAWPLSDAPPEGFDTEVRLPLRDDVDADALRDSLVVQVPDLLLALPALREIRIGDSAWRREDLGEDRVAVHGPERTEWWLLHRSSGRLPSSALAGQAAEQRWHGGWWVCWALPLDADGSPIAQRSDVLHAPTPTEERLSVPARLLASVPMEPDRRRVAASAATDSVLVHAAECYPDLVLKLAPRDRPALVPLPEFPLSDVDDKVRQAVVDRLRVAAWLPEADGGDVAPHAARVLDHASPDLVALLSDVVPGLLIPELSEGRYRRAMNVVEVARLGAADIVDAVSGMDRPASWWYRLYDALDPVERADTRTRDDFSALPVPLADGRTATGPRNVLITDGDSDPDPGEALSRLDISGLRITAPEAAHPLLERLGARRAGAVELLDAPPLAEAVERSVATAQAGEDVSGLAEAVLYLVGAASARDWMGALALPDADGEVRRADELLLPDAALHDVLDPDAVGEDAPLGVLHADVAQRWSRELLRSVGVLDTFAVVAEEEPADPYDALADVERWWAEREAAQPDQWPPARFVGVRDLDLVADDAWPQAIRLLASQADTLDALREPGGYSSWWIARFATLGGQEPQYWRLPHAEALEGLYDPVPDVGLTDEQLRLAGVREQLRIDDSADAADLTQRLGESGRKVRAGTALRAHRALADAVACGVVDARNAEPPRTVRSVSGAVVGAERAVVLDEPWLIGVFEAPLVVAGGSPDEFDAEALAELFDISLASEQGPMRVDGGHAGGDASDSAGAVTQQWGDVGRVPGACELLGVPVPAGEVTLQDGLTVHTPTGEHAVHWWVDETGVMYAERTPDGLGRALAWAADRWSERFALTALLADPEAVTLLR